MERGWKSREELNFDTAEVLLKQAQGLFEQEEDWFNVSECLNHLALTEKLRAVHRNLKGMHYSQQALHIAETHHTEKKLVLRALMSLASSSGLFESALLWGKEALDLFAKPAEKADILAHLANFYLRTGNLEKALESINEAERLLEQGQKTQEEPHRSIWESKICLTKALILYNHDKVEQAKEYFAKGYEVAKKQRLKTRIAEAEALKPLFGEG